MSSSFTARPVDRDLRLGSVPILTTGPTDDPDRWAAEHRDPLRSLVTEHGAVMVRGPGLHDVAGTASVFARPATGLTAETEAFAARRSHSTGRVYQAHTVRGPWQDGDLLLVDNLRTADSREAYEGPRDVMVALADAVHLADCSPTVEVMTR